MNKGTLVADKKLSELRDGKDQVLVVEFDFRVEEAFSEINCPVNP